MTISLANTRNELKYINEELQRKCSSSYKLELSQYKYRNLESVVYDETSDEYDIILCLYHGKRCVSSVTGRYNKTRNSMELLSKTAHEYEGLKFNLYLRSIFIYLMCFVRPTIKKIYSHSMNPISTYAMYKHYHANNPDLEQYVIDMHLTPETFTLENAIQFHSYFTEKYMQTPESAQKELDEMIEDCSVEYGMECTVQDLGWETTEVAIAFIMTTMNVKAITLEVDLETPGVKEFMLNKLLNTQIKCEQRQDLRQDLRQDVQTNMQVVGGKKKKKSCRNKSSCRKSCRNKSCRNKSCRKKI